MKRAAVNVSIAAFIALAASATGCGSSASSAPPSEYFAVPGNQNLPFSEAVRVGNMLYLAGQIGTDSSANVVSGGIEPETKQVLENIKAVLERHGSSIDRVVKCTAMLADMREWATMNGVYAMYFKKNLPARSAFGTTGLAKGARIELECWATVGSE